ncbi:EpsG family protein [Empedobacter falsenii]|uniref:EpsG family protein n=1 Tax=Empedobacter falsenii TaxID=343874 RepID=UPI001C8DC2E8|nr:EpsG family protein [Empedobacter falsenii]MBY0065618.1 EpsG family protein [Empedobacter falsenii]
MKESIINAFNLNYNLLYFALAIVVLFFVSEYVINKKKSNKLQNIILIIFACLYIFLIGTRDKFVGEDSERTLVYFLGIKTINSLDELKDIGIYLISKFARIISDDYKVFFTINSILYVVPITIGIFNITKKNRLIFFFLLVSMFFFKSMGINTTRQGIAFAFFFLAIALYNNKKWISIILLIIAFFNHASIIIPISFYLISKKFTDMKIVFIIYVTCTVISMFNINVNEFLGKIPIVNILVEERMNRYYKEEYQLVYKTGFRLDFFIFNTIFVYIGYNALKHLDEKIVTIKLYKNYLITYMFTSSFFFLMFSAAFSDRFGFLSWLFIPLILLPYLQTNKRIGKFNISKIYIICLIIFIFFNFR